MAGKSDNTSLWHPLRAEQVSAAGRLHRGLRQWVDSDQALKELRATFPLFDDKSQTLIKAVAVDRLYGTNVVDIVSVARHVHDVLMKANLSAAGPELVDKMAKYADTYKRRTSRFVSFSAKFAHFFIDDERFPIYDSYARGMTWHHLGMRHWRKVPNQPYAEFTHHFNLLRELSGFACKPRELDRYLWLTGLYRKYKRRTAEGKEPQVNLEALRLFERPEKQQKKCLKLLAID